MSRRYEKAAAYTEKYKHMLLPCRYCGNTDVRIVSDREMLNPRDMFFVSCQTPKCDCTGSFTSVRAAIKHWNERQAAEAKW